MKEIRLFIFIFFIGQCCFGQSNPIYLSINTKLIPQIQLITPHGKTGIRENYTYFKGVYWKGETDTVSMTIIEKIESKKSKKEKIKYERIGACDSIINEIRNNTQYREIQNEIDKIARQEIGYDNDEFNNFSRSIPNEIKDFSKICHDKFKTEIFKFRKQLLKKIQRIKSEKEDRYTKLETSPELHSTEIASFFKTYDSCDTDFKSLELIIIKHPAKFMNSVDKMNESDFFTFTLKLDNFPQNSNTSKMKENLKETLIKSKRKRTIIRKIKKRKANNETK